MATAPGTITIAAPPFSRDAAAARSTPDATFNFPTEPPSPISGSRSWIAWACRSRATATAPGGSGNLKFESMKNVILLLALAFPCFAADLSGTWKSEFDSQIGRQKYTYTLKQEGT